MTREELLFKKREIQKQMDAIDRVLEMFPEKTPTIRGSGRYASMSVANAAVDFLSRTPGHPVTVGDIAKALKAEGIKSTSPNFSTIVSTVCNRLTTGKKPKLVRRKKNGRKAFAVSSGEIGEEK